MCTTNWFLIPEQSIHQIHSQGSAAFAIKQQQQEQNPKTTQTKPNKKKKPETTTTKKTTTKFHLRESELGKGEEKPLVYGKQLCSCQKSLEY